MTRYVSKQQQFGHLWIAEVERFEYDDADWATVACADLADELWHHRIAAVEDPDYQTELDEWTDFVYEHQLMLPLEQSCHERVLLPTSSPGSRSISICWSGWTGPGERASRIGGPRPRCRLRRKTGPSFGRRCCGPRTTRGNRRLRAGW